MEQLLQQEDLKLGLQEMIDSGSFDVNKAVESMETDIRRMRSNESAIEILQKSVDAVLESKNISPAEKEAWKDAMTSLLVDKDKMDNEEYAKAFLDRVEFRQPEQMLDTMKDVTKTKMQAVNFKRIGGGEFLGNPETSEGIRIQIEGMDIILFNEISSPLTHKAALDWCKERGARLPTLAELKLLAQDEEIRNMLDEDLVWTSTQDTRANYQTFYATFNAKTGEVIYKDENAEGSLAVARAVSDTIPTTAQ
jgi:hypothetical protein